MRRRRIAPLIALTLGFWSLVVPSAQAYVDPGSGSFVFQIAVGAVLAAGLALKTFWKRVTGFLSRGRRSEDLS